eukprot:Skav233742  [mRNA]  locus=scaffold2303:151900:155166:- [translate_table: standard]
MLPCEPHHKLSEWTFQGTPLSSFHWNDAVGNPYDPTSLVGFTQQVSSDLMFEWPRYPSESEIMLVHVHNGKITQNMIEFSPGQEVESVMFAEQVLMGPSCRLARVHDRYANTAPQTELLSRLSVLVMHWEDSHNLIKIVIAREGIRREHWVTRGTRVFQLVEPKANLIVVRPNGFETPWDYPFFGPIEIQIITRDEESDASPSATLPFVAETPPDSERLNLTTPNLNMGHVIAATTAEVKQTIADTLTQAPHSENPWDTSCRFQQLWEFGHVVADDEMSYICRIMENTTSTFMRGIFKWEHDKSTWICHPQWRLIDQASVDHASVVVLHYDNHWIPALMNPQNMTITYRCRFVIPSPAFNELTAVWGIQQHSVFRQDESDPYGWCGWGAIAWIFARLAINPPNMDRSVAREAVRRFAEMIGPLKFRDYEAKMQIKKPDLNSMMGLRDLFIQRMLTWPTQSYYTGRGTEDNQPSNLKLTGKIAAIFIAHGHSDEESLSTARQLAQRFPKQARSIPSQKDSKAYTALLELCNEHNIHVNSSRMNIATTKLQRFFRTKQARKQKQSVPIDLRHVQFHDDTFTINGASVKPAAKWSASTSGLALATPEEILPFVEKDQLLSLDVNTAILNCWIPVGKNITIEQKEVPVMDADQNHAIIRIWLVHFGQKRPSRQPAIGSSVDVEADETVVLLLQVYRNLVDAEFWQALMESPAKQIMQNYFDQGETHQVIQLWSRRWNNKGKPSNKVEADSFSLLCRVNKPEAPTWLRRSGTGTPCMFGSLKADRNDTDEAVNSHRVVWCSKAIHDTLVLLARIPDHCGVVHRAPHSYGIRVEKSRFGSAWKELKGESEPIPSQIPCKVRYLLAGAPPALTGPKLESWSKEVSWPIRVLRSYGGGRFLVGSETAVPTPHMVIQNHQIICQPYIEKSSRQVPPIVLGKLNLPVDKDGKGDDQQLHNDPWAASSGLPKPKDHSHHAAWAHYRPTTKPDQTMQVDAQDTTTEVVAKQSARIAVVEEQLKCLQDQMSADQKSNQSRFTQLDHNIQSMSSSLRSTLEEALKQQSANLVHTFDQLLKRSPRPESHHSGDRSRSPVGKEK